MATSPYRPASQGGSYALHAPDWHGGCPNVELVDLAGRPMLWCPDCRCLCSMEAVAFKAHPLASMTPAPPQPTEASK